MKLIINEKGQALLIVIVALTIALVIGINASVRTITSLSRTSRTDTASRALAASEGGIERFLILTKSELDAVASGVGSNYCPDVDGITEVEINGVAGCSVSFASDTDNIDSEAFVTVELYVPDIYPFALESGQIREINLQGYTSNTITLCWRSNAATSTGSDLYYVVYGSSGIVQGQNRLLRGVNPPNAPYATNGQFAANASNPDTTNYDNCYDISGVSSAYGLRVRSIGGDSSIGVFAATGHTLPLQGHRIVSIGKLLQNTSVTASRRIQVIRTLPYLPGPFDFSYYTVGDIVK